MTVAELIEQLSQIGNQNQTIKIQISYRNGFCESTDLEVSDNCIFGIETYSDWGYL